jgi:MFS family permease
MTGMVFAFGLYLQIGLGWSALRAGLTQAPWAAGIAVGAALSAAVLGRRFGRRILQAGAVLAALGVAATLAAFTAAGADVTPWQPAPVLLVTGLGMGLLIAPLFDIVLAAVSLPMVGSGSGVLNATQQLGSTAGVATLGTMFFGPLDRGDALGGLQSVLATTAALILSTAVLAFLLPRYARESDAATAAVTDPASANEGALRTT